MRTPFIFAVRKYVDLRLMLWRLQINHCKLYFNTSNLRFSATAQLPSLQPASLPPPSAWGGSDDYLMSPLPRHWAASRPDIASGYDRSHRSPPAARRGPWEHSAHLCSSLYKAGMSNVALPAIRAKAALPQNCEISGCQNHEQISVSVLGTEGMGPRIES